MFGRSSNGNEAETLYAYTPSEQGQVGFETVHLYVYTPSGTVPLALAWETVYASR